MMGDVIGWFPDSTIIAPGTTIGNQEVDHRVANSLELISSLLSIQARDTSRQFVRDALESTVHRIQALAGVRQQLYRLNSEQAVDIAAYLLTLSSKMVQCSRSSSAPRQIITHAQSHLVSANFASMLGILTNEPVMNACKRVHAPDEPGEIEVVLFFASRMEFLMEVRDSDRLGDVQEIPITSVMGCASSKR